jgi:hypothetical protein
VAIYVRDGAKLELYASWFINDNGWAEQFVRTKQMSRSKAEISKATVLQIMAAL